MPTCDARQFVGTSRFSSSNRQAIRCSRDDDALTVEWVRDSAYRFFPLVEHVEFGLALHPFDLATNKVLALIGRTEARDWIDIIDCHRSLQPLG